MIPSAYPCTVYHGTNLFSAKVIQQYGIWLSVQRRLTDFGKGFYVTFNLKQAKNWARVRALHPQVYPLMLERLKITKDQYFHQPDIWKPAYLAFQLDINRLLALHGKIFPMPDEPAWPVYRHSWESFVAQCRAGKRHAYDYVYGPVGGWHPTIPNRIRLAFNKDQLSLNSPRALRCLNHARVVTFEPEKPPPAFKRFQELTPHLKRNKDVYTGVPELDLIQPIRDEMTNIGHISRKQADQILQKYLDGFHPAEKEALLMLLMREPPAYGAFSVLYGNRKLWYSAYETYTIRKFSHHI